MSLTPTSTLSMDFTLNTAQFNKIEQWKIVEDLQEKYLHLRFGWYGFIPMVYEDDAGTADINMGKL